jgi:ketosteroid isomerase-like protein
MVRQIRSVPMTIELPDSIAGYFAADAGGDVRALLRLFAEDATVIDEHRTYTGCDEIHAWKRDASTKYRYTVDPVAIDEQDGSTIVTAHVSGDFPGSPIDLRYAFTLGAGLITRLEIAP